MRRKGKRVIKRRLTTKKTKARFRMEMTTRKSKVIARRRMFFREVSQHYDLRYESESQSDALEDIEHEANSSSPVFPSVEELI